MEIFGCGGRKLNVHLNRNRVYKLMLCRIYVCIYPVVGRRRQQREENWFKGQRGGGGANECVIARLEPLFFYIYTHISMSSFGLFAFGVCAVFGMLMLSLMMCRCNIIYICKYILFPTTYKRLTTQN